MTAEEFHNYKLPSVTGILSEVFGQDEFKNIPERVLQAACERGSAVHESIENYINTKEMKINLEYQIYVDYFKDWEIKYEPIFIFSEQRVVSEKYGFKGIIDTLFIETSNVIDNTLVLCDWKTSSNLNIFKTKCQLNLYLLLLEEAHPEYKDKVDKLKILSLTKSGYKYYEFNPDRELALSILKIYREKRGE